MDKNIFKKYKYNYKLAKSFKEKGYALLFTVIIVSIISVISIGLSSTTYKQMILSSEASSSELAFYESDMAMECALYVDNQTTYLTDGKTPSFNCGVDTNGQPYSLNIIKPKVDTYNLKPSSSILNSSDPCFDINIVKNSSSSSTKTTILANGYNICNKKSNRTVERTIEVDY